MTRVSRKEVAKRLVKTYSPNKGYIVKEILESLEYRERMKLAAEIHIVWMQYNKVVF